MKFKKGVIHQFQQKLISLQNKCPHLSCMFVYLSTLFPGNPLGPIPTGLGSPCEPLRPFIPGIPSEPFSPHGPVNPFSPFKPKRESKTHLIYTSVFLILERQF